MTEQEIKAAVRKRDGFLCVDCGITQGQHIEHFGRGLDVHRLSPGSEYSIDGCVALPIQQTSAAQQAPQPLHASPYLGFSGPLI